MTAKREIDQAVNYEKKNAIKIPSPISFGVAFNHSSSFLFIFQEFIEGHGLLSYLDHVKNIFKFTTTEQCQRDNNNS